jgi:hypothetical protein
VTRTSGEGFPCASSRTLGSTPRGEQPLAFQGNAVTPLGVNPVQELANRVIAPPGADAYSPPNDLKSSQAQSGSDTGLENTWNPVVNLAFNTYVYEVARWPIEKTLRSAWRLGFRQTVYAACGSGHPTRMSARKRREVVRLGRGRGLRGSQLLLAEGGTPGLSESLQFLAKHLPAPTQ